MNIVKKDLQQTKLKKPKKSYAGRKSELVLLCMALPMLIYTLIFKYVPLVGNIIAFKDYKYNLGIFGSKWVGLSNFKFFFNSPDAWRITRNTLGYNLVFIVLGVIIPVTMAFLLAEIRNRKALKTYQTLMLIPNYLSWVVVAFIGYAFLNMRYGVINSILSKMGMEPINWYVEAGPWTIIIILVQVWKGVGVSTLMYYAALMGIDKEYYEAAILDGASKWQISVKISLPFLYPLIIMLTLLGIGGIFTADFGLFYQMPMNSTLLYPTTDVIDTYVFRALKDNANVGMSSAIDFFKSLMGFVCIFLSNQAVRKVSPENSLF